MSRKWQLAVAGIVLALILLIVGIPWYVPALVVVVALAIPIIGYRMLDPYQRKRLGRIAKRKQLGR